MNIKEKAYEKYKFRWLFDHGYTLEDVLKSAYEIMTEEDIDTEDVLVESFEEFGLNGEIYVCFDEFVDNEYQDTEIMESLLGGPSSDLYREYLNDIQLGG